MMNSSLRLQKYVKCKMWKKWQLFHAKDYQSLMNPCFVFCSVLGIFPYKSNGSTFEISKQHYILSTIIFCVFCVYELVILYEINITGKVKFSDMPRTLQYNCVHTLGIFMGIITYILHGPRMHLLQTIMNISSELPFNLYKKLSKLIHTKDILGFSFLVTLTVFHYSKMILDNWYKAAIPYIILMVFQMDMLYMNCVCVLKACFKRIDDSLISLQEHIVNDKPHLLRRTYHEQRDSFLLMELTALKKQHLAVSDTVQMLNKVFSLQLLSTIVMTFTVLTFYLYFYIKRFKLSMLTNSQDYLLFDVISIVVMTYYSIKMVLIVWACETGKDVSMKIGNTIHDLLNNTSNKQIKDKLQLFSLQVLHYENTFSAKGLVVDVTLLVAIVTNITTYLLILIQFFIATYLCNRNVANNVTQII